MLVPTILYPILTLIVLLVGPFSLSATLGKGVFVLAVLNLIFGAKVLITTDLFQRMRMSADNWRSGCFNLTILYMPILLSGIYLKAVWKALVASGLPLLLMLSLFLAAHAGYFGQLGIQAWMETARVSRRVAELEKPHTTDPVENRTTCYPGQKTTLTLPLGFSSYYGGWLIRDPKASLKLSNGTVLDLSSGLSPAQNERTPQHGELLPCHLNVNLQIPAYATEGTDLELSCRFLAFKKLSTDKVEPAAAETRTYRLRIRGKAEVDALVAQQKAKLAGEKELVKLKTFVPGYKRPLALSVVLFLLALVSFVAHRQTVTAKVTPRVKAAEGNQKLDAVAVSED